MSEIKRLIEFVKERPFLYDYSHPNYRNRPTRLEAWKEIAREMGAGNANIWSAKWKGLKDNYAKFKKTSNPYCAEMYKKYKNWPWAEQVRFLDDYNSTSSKAKAKAKETHDPKAQGYVQQMLYINMAGSSMGEVNNLEVDALENVTNEIKKEQYITEPTEELQNVTTKNNEDKPALDGIDHFFLSYAQSFKSLPTRMQIMLKLDIATLFSRYELQAEGVTKELFDSIPRIVPHPVKFEYDFANTIDD